MCILLKLDYAKFGVSNLFFSKVIEEKPLFGGVGSISPPLVKKGLKKLEESKHAGNTNNIGIPFIIRFTITLHQSCKKWTYKIAFKIT